MQLGNESQDKPHVNSELQCTLGFVKVFVPVQFHPIVRQECNIFKSGT